MKTLVQYRYVAADRDRHGNRRYYFRRKGFRKVRLPGKPGTLKFQEAYEAALKIADAQAATAPAIGSEAKAGTLEWLCRRYFLSTDFKQLDPSTRVTRRQVFEHILSEPIAPGVQETFAELPAARMTAKAVRVLRDRKSAYPNAANTRVKAIRRLFKWAIEDEVSGISANPARDVSYLKTRPGGYHSWTAGEVQQFEDHHPIGTKARLAFALLLYTGQRRSDVVLFGKQHVNDGWLRFTQRKNRNRRPITLELPILPVLQDIIGRSPVGDLTFLVTDQGYPFTGNGFGNKMRQWCDEAGLPECASHGLRKAGAAIAAENGATAHQLMSIFGWLTLKEAERYTRAAAQRKLAASAMSLLERKST
jgi:integrase